MGLQWSILGWGQVNIDRLVATTLFEDVYLTVLAHLQAQAGRGVIEFCLVGAKQYREAVPTGSSQL